MQVVLKNRLRKPIQKIFTTPSASIPKLTPLSKPSSKPKPRFAIKFQCTPYQDLGTQLNLFQLMWISMKKMEMAKIRPITENIWY